MLRFFKVAAGIRRGAFKGYVALLGQVDKYIVNMTQLIARNFAALGQRQGSRNLLLDLLDKLTVYRVKQLLSLDFGVQFGDGILEIVHGHGIGEYPYQKKGADAKNTDR